MRAMSRAQSRQWMLNLLLTHGQRGTGTQHRRTGTGKNKDAIRAVRQIKFKVTLVCGLGTKPGQRSMDYIPTLIPALWKKKEQCTAEQLQLRALKNLKFSQVSGFSAVKKTPGPQKRTNQQNPLHKTKAQGLVQVWPCLCTTVRIKNK